MAHFARYAVPPLAWAGLIFFLSHRPSSAYEAAADAAPTVPGLSYLVHGLLYMILAALVLRWLLSPKVPRLAPSRAAVAVIAVAATSIYGLSDEFHQTFVPGRTFQMFDLLADAAGAAASVSAWALWGLVGQSASYNSVDAHPPPGTSQQAMDSGAEMPPTGPEPPEPPEPPSLLDHLAETLRVADDMALPPTDRATSKRIRDELVPALLEARTYVEVGRITAPEVRLNLSAAAGVASSLADGEARLAPLLSRVKVLQERAGAAAREV